MATNWKTQVAVTQEARQDHGELRKNVASCDRSDSYGENKGWKRIRGIKENFVEGECRPLKCQAIDCYVITVTL